MLKYVLITTANNEEKTIEQTILSVIKQTKKPERWIIVSDASTDRTDAIINKYAEIYLWIIAIRIAESSERDFYAKAYCFEKATELVANINYDIIGNMDADITVDDEYYEFLLIKFSKNDKLGVAGTPFKENNYNSVTDSNEGERHVAGGCQLFRRKCYEDIGGYQKIRGGGVDWIAVTTARMKGWETYSFRDKYFYHHRSLGMANKSVLMARYNYGQKDYNLGGHPLWEMSRVVYQMIRKPYIIGGFMILLGYSISFITLKKRNVSVEFMKFHRKEQMNKLCSIIRNKLTLK